MCFFVSEAEIIHRDSLQLKWQPSRRVKVDLLYLLAITNKVSWGYLCILSMKIYIYVNLKTYTQLDDQPLILSSKMSCQRSMSGFLDLSSFLSARTQQMGGYQKLYSNRTDPYSPNVQSFGGCLKQSVSFVVGVVTPLPGVVKEKTVHHDYGICGFFVYIYIHMLYFCSVRYIASPFSATGD